MDLKSRLQFIGRTLRSDHNKCQEEAAPERCSLGGEMLLEAWSFSERPQPDAKCCNMHEAYHSIISHNISKI